MRQKDGKMNFADYVVQEYFFLRTFCYSFLLYLIIKN